MWTPNFWTSALVAVEWLGAFTLVILMQKRFRDADTSTFHGRVCWFRRLVFSLLAGFMVWHSAEVLELHETYNCIDALGTILPVAAIISFSLASIYQHSEEQKWLSTQYY